VIFDKVNSALNFCYPVHFVTLHGHIITKQAEFGLSAVVINCPG
jgi:hypothetical protein